MGKGRKSLALLLILALLASLLTGCAVTTVSEAPAQSGQSQSAPVQDELVLLPEEEATAEAEPAAAPAEDPATEEPPSPAARCAQGGRPCLSHRLRPPARELHHQERSPRRRLGGWQPGAILPRQVHRGRPLRQPGGPAALCQGPGLDRVRHQHPGQKIPGGRAHGLFQRWPDLLYRGPLREL